MAGNPVPPIPSKDGQLVDIGMVDGKHENSLHLMDPNAGLGAPPPAVGMLVRLGDK